MTCPPHNPPRSQRSLQRTTPHVRAWTPWVCALITTAATWALLPAHTAHAQPKKPVQCTLSKGLACTVNVSRSFSTPIRKRLRSGLRNTILYRLYIRRSDTHQPVSLTALRLSVVFELWDEVFFVSQNDSTTPSFTTSDETALIRELSVLDDLPAAQDLPPGTYYADLIVEINPLSPQDEAELRSWIARSRGGHRSFASGDRSFLGTFVSLFTNIRPGQAEHAFRHQTTAFVIPPPTTSKDAP